jgi:hypothetical protein
MNYLRAIIALFILSPVIVAGPPKRLAFGNMKFQHAWEEKKQIVTNEYVELGQTLENWQHMLAYRQYPGYTKPATIINAYFRQIKPTETPAIYRKDESGNDMIFVFLMEAPDKSYMEFKRQGKTNVARHACAWPKNRRGTVCSRACGLLFG